jgi:putative ABC transport system permease protein
VAGLLKLDFPEVERAARFESMDGVIKLGAAAAQERIVWADPDFFEVMRYPVLAGDADAALATPDGLVITRQLARKYFGQDAPIGRTVLVDANPDVIPQLVPITGGLRPMRVLAVLKDIPSNSHLDAQVFASARAAASNVALEDRRPSPFNLTMTTYVKLRPGASIEAVRRGAKAFADRHYAPAPGAAARM